MNKLKYLLIPLLSILLLGCQARIGKIEMLDNLKVSDISGIYASKYNDNSSASLFYQGYLTENDETVIINVLKKLNNNNIDYIVDVNDIDYCLEVETLENNYKIYISSVDQMGVICIKDTWYQSSSINKIIEALDSASYLEK